jgi:hypothetical protein
MARKKPPIQVPEDLKNLVEDVSNPLALSDVDSYGKLREIQDRSHQIRTIVKAWKDQQIQDRRMRERYANYLIAAMGLQTLVVNVVFVLIGVGMLTFEPWTARTFIMAVFAEIAAMVLIVIKYLFTPSSDKVLQFLHEKKSSTRIR